MTTIYFIRSGTDGPIKIGHTKTSDRKRFLQTGNPEVLETIRELRNVPQSTEKKLHHAFSKFRINGEWFEPSQAIMDFIFAEDWQEMLDQLISEASAKPSETEQVTFRLKSSVVDKYKKAARKASYEQDKDIGYTDLIREDLENGRLI